MIFRRRRDSPSPGLDWDEDGPWRSRTDVSTRETIDFDGRTYFCRRRRSPGGSFTVVFGTPIDRGRSRGFLFRDGELEWTTPLELPVLALVGDQGTVLVLEGGSQDGLDGRLRVFDRKGSSLLTRSYDSNVADADLSADGRVAAVQTQRPDTTTYLFDLSNDGREATHSTDWADPRYVRLVSEDDSWYAYLGESLEKKPLYALRTDGTLAWESRRFRTRKPLSERIRSRMAEL